jgi:hypothetical protein
MSERLKDLPVPRIRRRAAPAYVPWDCADFRSMFFKIRVCARRAVAMAEHLFKCAPVGKEEERSFLARIAALEEGLSR